MFEQAAKLEYPGLGDSTVTIIRATDRSSTLDLNALAPPAPKSASRRE